jgi:hypothetical protein
MRFTLRQYQRRQPPSSRGIKVSEMESWTEVNLVPARELDRSLLTAIVDPLVHETLAGQLETWFYFWEPELRLRFRWTDVARAADLRGTCAALLDEHVRSGRLDEWYEGAHGNRGEQYAGEAEMYGPEMWDIVQTDWMNGSELALRLARLEQADALSRSRAFHWQRHVHLITNQQFGTWNDEIELCLGQALGYLGHIAAAGGTPSPEALRLIGELERLAAGQPSGPADV